MANEADKILNIHENDILSGSIKYPDIFGKSTSDILNACGNITNVELEKEQGEEAQPTNQIPGFLLQNQTVIAPVDIVKARSLKDISPHHASCIQSKKYSTMGLGFVSEASEIEDSKAKSPDSVTDTENKILSLLTGEAFIESKVDKELDHLTMQGFMFELYRAVEDFLDGGTGYLEIIRDKENVITGINWIPFEELDIVRVIDAKGKTRLVYRYTGPLFAGTTTRWFSRFGTANRQWVWENFYNNGRANIDGTVNVADRSNVGSTVLVDGRVTTDTINVDGLDITNVSEIIAFMVPSNRSRYHGYPEWLAAASFVSILSMAMQYKSDFYTNKGVLAYILSVAGNVPADQWKKIEDLIQGSIGGGHNWKNLAININDPKAKVKVDKLAASDKTEEQFAKDSEVFAQSIVSAHRVPPVLANILIPGKLGATNEAVQALVTYQLLVIGPYQTMIQKTLARTLGSKTEGIKGLSAEDFRLRTITSQFDITGLDTIGRAREEAAGSNRDFSEGVKD